MGTSGLEPPTSRLSGVRSNHLSYAPKSKTWYKEQSSKRVTRIELATTAWKAV
ncbi:putative conjugative element protein, partial [Streptococcus pneumoniae]